MIAILSAGVYVFVMADEIIDAKYISNDSLRDAIIRYELNNSLLSERLSKLNDTVEKSAEKIEIASEKNKDAIRNYILSTTSHFEKLKDHMFSKNKPEYEERELLGILNKYRDAVKHSLTEAENLDGKHRMLIETLRKYTEEHRNRNRINTQTIKDFQDSLSKSGDNAPLRDAPVSFFKSSITRIGALIILLYAVQILGRKYEYMMRLASDCDSMADGLEFIISSGRNPKTIDPEAMALIISNFRPKVVLKDVKAPMEILKDAGIAATDKMGDVASSVSPGNWRKKRRDDEPSDEGKDAAEKKKDGED